MKKYIITICILIGLLLASLTGYFVYSRFDSDSTISNLKSKVNEEIKYLDTKIISVINNFNNISYANYKVVEQQIPINTSDSQNSSGGNSGGGQSQEGNQGMQQSGSESMEQSNTITSISVIPDGVLTNSNNKIDWKNIKEQIEIMYSAWTTILIDLNTLNVNKDNLLKFNNILDNLATSLDKEDKKASVARLAELYNLLPLYIKDYTADRNMLSVYNTKANVLYAYALMEYENKGNEIKGYIGKAKNEFSYIVNNPMENSNNINSINKVYVELNELEKNNSIKQKKIFYIHYKNLMQELEII